MSTLEDSDLLLVQRGDSKHKVTVENMSTIQDDDLLLVQRGAQKYKITGKDFVDSSGGSPKPPSVDSALLLSDNTTFSNSEFTTVPVNFDSGNPASFQKLKAKVSGNLDVVPETAPIANINSNNAFITEFDDGTSYVQGVSDYGTPKTITIPRGSSETHKFYHFSNGNTTNWFIASDSDHTFNKTHSNNQQGHTVGYRGTKSNTLGCWGRLADANGVSDGDGSLPASGLNGTTNENYWVFYVNTEALKVWISVDDGVTWIGGGDGNNLSSTPTFFLPDDGQNIVFNSCTYGTQVNYLDNKLSTISLTFQNNSNLDNGLFSVGDTVLSNDPDSMGIFSTPMNDFPPGFRTGVSGSYPTWAEFSADWSKELKKPGGNYVNGNTTSTWEFETTKDLTIGFWMGKNAGTGTITLSGDINNAGTQTVTGNTASSPSLIYVELKKGSGSFTMQGVSGSYGYGRNAWSGSEIKIKAVRSEVAQMDLNGGSWAFGETVKNAKLKPEIVTPESDVIVGTGDGGSLQPKYATQKTINNPVWSASYLQSNGVTAVTGFYYEPVNTTGGWYNQLVKLKINGQRFQVTGLEESHPTAGSSYPTRTWRSALVETGQYVTPSYDILNPDGYYCTFDPVPIATIEMESFGYSSTSAGIYEGFGLYDQNGNKFPLIGDDPIETLGYVELASAKDLLNFGTGTTLTQDSGHTIQTDNVLSATPRGPAVPTGKVMLSAHPLDPLHSYVGYAGSVSNTVDDKNLKLYNSFMPTDSGVIISGGTKVLWRYDFGPDGPFEMKVWNTIPTGNGGTFTIYEVGRSDDTKLVTYGSGSNGSTVAFTPENSSGALMLESTTQIYTYALLRDGSSQLQLTGGVISDGVEVQLAGNKDMNNIRIGDSFDGNVVTDINLDANKLVFSSGSFTVGQPLTGPTFDPATGVANNVNGNVINLSNAEGRFIVDQGKYLIGEEQPASSVSAYLTWNNSNQVTGMTSADPGFVVVDNLKISFPEYAPTGELWDVELPAGTYIQTNFFAENAIGSTESGWTDIYKPRSLPYDSNVQESFTEKALRFHTFENRKHLYCAKQVEEQRDVVISKLAQEGYDLNEILKYL